MIASDVVICYLALLMHNEPKDDGFLGQTCCGLLVRNRVLAGWNGQNWISIIEEYDKHNGNPSETPRVFKLGDPIRDDKFRRTLGIAANIYEGREKDITFGALRGTRLDKCSEEFANKIVRPKDPITGLQIHPRVAQVGKVAFFK